MLRRAVTGFVFASLSLFCGCAGSVSVVHEANDGGTLALSGPEGSAREKADAVMKARCPMGYEIVEQGDAMTADGDTEWRIVYACKGTHGKVAAIAF